MAAGRSYDIGLDDFIKSNRANKVNRRAIVRNRRSQSNQPIQNNNLKPNKTLTSIGRINRNKNQNFSIQRYNKSPMVKIKRRDARLAINQKLKNNQQTKNQQSKKQQKVDISGIIKTQGVGKEIQIFTRHYDARSRLITQKKPKEQPKKSPNKKSPRSKGLAPSALKAVSKDSKQNKLNERRNFQMVGNKLKITTKREPQQDRDSIFTGKSIQVVAKNIQNNRERKALARGSQPKAVSRDQGKTRPVTIGRQSSQRQSSQNLSQSYFTPSSELEPVKRSTGSTTAKVVISNLHPNVTQSDIKELFGAIGDLIEAQIVSLGTAEVVFNSVDDAFASYSKYHGRNLDGQPMICKIMTVDNENDQVTSRTAHPAQHVSTPPSPALVTTSAQKNKNSVVFTVKL